ncbi:hypothetical protein ABZ281_25595, partial [Streptomyces sp. NPDC006265]|uniref:hypothetical protein n=1 Tax=Streptomyces sp. NPDC006265 TaxID=3156740 RepID=UPI00339F61D6
FVRLIGLVARTQLTLSQIPGARRSHAPDAASCRTEIHQKPPRPARRALLGAVVDTHVSP